MVRRWSYLNLLNTSHFLLDSTSMKHMRVHMFRTFKATTFFRKKLYIEGPTKLTRKSYYQRRRVNNSLFYYNVMINWSQDYLFFRKYSRELLMLGSSTYNYLMQNTLVYSKTPLNELVGYESIRFTYFVKSVLGYCFNPHTFNLSPLYSMRRNSFMYVTTLHPLVVNKKQKTLSDDPTYQLSNRSRFTPSSQSLAFPFPKLISLVFSSFMSNLTSLYRVLILLVYYNQRK